MLNEYDKIINEQLNLNIIEKVNKFDKIGETHYHPHKVVVRDEKETTKFEECLMPAVLVGKVDHH